MANTYSDIQSKTFHKQYSFQIGDYSFNVKYQKITNAQAVFQNLVNWHINNDKL